MNSLFPEESVSTDSDKDLAEELDELFRFMILNDLSGEKEEEESSFIEDEERECCISATDPFPEIDYFDDITTDINLKYPIIEQGFPLPLKKKGTVFPCKPDQKLPEDVYS